MTLSHIPNRGRSRDEAIEYWRPRGQRHDPSHRTYDYSGAFPFASDILRHRLAGGTSSSATLPDVILRSVGLP